MPRDYNLMNKQNDFDILCVCGRLAGRNTLAIRLICDDLHDPWLDGATGRKADASLNWRLASIEGKTFAFCHWITDLASAKNNL